MSLEFEKLVELIRKLDIIEKGNFRLSSGGYSDWKFSIEKGLANTEFCEFVGRKTAGLFYSIEADSRSQNAVATVDTGGTEFLKACLPYMKIKSFVTVTKNNELCGKLDLKPYVIFEDVVTEGRSVKRVADVLKTYNIDVAAAISVLDREQGGKEFLAKHGIELYSLLAKRDVVHLI